MITDLRSIIRGPHQMFIENHFLTGMEWPDWRIVRNETDFEDVDFRQKTYMLQHIEDRHKLLLVKIGESNSKEASDAGLEFFGTNSAAETVTAAEADPDGKAAQVHGMGTKVLVNRQRFARDNQHLTGVSYTIANMTVEIRSVGDKDVYLSEFSEVAKQFFSIPRLVRGEISLLASEMVLPEGQKVVMPVHDDEDRWHMLLADSEELSIAIREGKLFLNRSKNSPKTIRIYHLITDKKFEQTLSGPVIFSL